MPEEIKPRIETSLVANTAHITKEDASLLCDAADEGGDPIIVYDLDVGFLVYISHTQGLDRRGSLLSADFWRLYEWAQALGCTYLHLDSTGTVYPHLAKHVWEFGLL